MKNYTNCSSHFGFFTQNGLDFLGFFQGWIQRQTHFPKKKKKKTKTQHNPYTNFNRGMQNGLTFYPN